MTRAILALCLLCACGDSAPKVVTRTEVSLPAPPSPDLLVQPSPVITAGSKDLDEVITRLALGNVSRDKIISGWIVWWLAAKLSAEKANAAEGAKR